MGISPIMIVPKVLLTSVRMGTFGSMEMFLITSLTHLTSLHMNEVYQSAPIVSMVSTRFPVMMACILYS